MVAKWQDVADGAERTRTQSQSAVRQKAGNRVCRPGGADAGGQDHNGDKLKSVLEVSRDVMKHC